MKKTKRIVFTILRTAFAVALLIYLGRSGVINWSALRGLVAAWPVTLAALGLMFVATVAVAWRLCVLMRPVGLHLSLGASLRLTLIGAFFNSCLPGATSGDLIKIYYAAEGHRGRRTQLTTIMLLDRVTGMFALVSWPLLAAPFFPRLVGSSAILRGLLMAAAAIAATMLVGVLFSSSTKLKNSRRVAWIFSKLPLGDYAKKALDTLYVYRHNRGTLAAAVLISLLTHTMTIGVTLLIAQAINSGGVRWEMSILAPLGFLANTLPLTPGGLGVGETAFSKLFALAGLVSGAEILLGWRLLTILCTGTGIVFYLQGRKSFIHVAAPAEEIETELSFT